MWGVNLLCNDWCIYLGAVFEISLRSNSCFSWFLCYQSTVFSGESLYEFVSYRDQEVAVDFCKR